MDCPVCGDTATEDITSHTFYGKTVRCPSCGEYDIVGSVYEPGALKALAPAKRKDALHFARQLAPLGAPAKNHSL